MDNNEENNENKEPKEPNENSNSNKNKKVSKVSLKIKSEQTNIAINKASSVKLTSYCQLKDDDDDEAPTKIDCPPTEAAPTDEGTSQPPISPTPTTNPADPSKADVSLIFTTSNYRNSTETLLSETEIHQPTREIRSVPETIGRQENFVQSQTINDDTESIRTAPDACPCYSTIREESRISIVPPAIPPLVLYSAPPISGAPPTYSAIMRLGGAPNELSPRRSFRLFTRREMQIQPSAPFIAPTPPPTYAEAHAGICAQSRPFVQHTFDIQDSVWGPDPIPVICPTCNHFIITNVHIRRSNLTHFSALALCICGCWPCCLLPYCLKTCKTTYHECPICMNIIGMYNPW